MNWNLIIINTLLDYITTKIQTLREFWHFLKNPKAEMLKCTKPRPEYPKLLKDTPYGTHKFIQLPGLRMHYVESGPQNAELLLLIHGFPDFWYTWKRQILEFSTKYWVVAVDMRGYGDTEQTKKISSYHINILVEDIKNLILKLGRQKFTLIAHDWGGVVAHYFIRIHPEMLNRYILLNTVFHPTFANVLFIDFKQMLKSWYILIMRIPYYAEYFILSDDLKKIDVLYEDVLNADELEIYKYMFGSYEKIRGPINYYRANYRNWKKNEIPNATKLNKANVPGLYIHGENDFALTIKMAFTKSFEGIKNIKFVSIPNAGHFVHMCSAEEVNNTIKDFLQTTD